MGTSVGPTGHKGHSSKSLRLVFSAKRLELSTSRTSHQAGWQGTCTNETICANSKALFAFYVCMRIKFDAKKEETNVPTPIKRQTSIPQNEMSMEQGFQLAVKMHNYTNHSFCYYPKVFLLPGLITSSISGDHLAGMEMSNAVERTCIWCRKTVVVVVLLLIPGDYGQFSCPQCVSVSSVMQ